VLKPVRLVKGRAPRPTIACQETIMLKDEMRRRMLEAMKAGRTVEKGILRVALGEVQTLESRTGETAPDPLVEKILRKVIKSNDESMGKTSDAARRAVLAEENGILASFLPTSLTPEEIVDALGPRTRRRPRREQRRPGDGDRDEAPPADGRRRGRQGRQRRRALDARL